VKKVGKSKREQGDKQEGRGKATTVIRKRKSSSLAREGRKVPSLENNTAETGDSETPLNPERERRDV